jgi:hypothetical protein
VPDERTREQIAADQKLTEAIQQVVNAYEHLPVGALLQDYIVQGRGTRWNDEGEQISHIFSAFPNGSLDPTIIAGHATVAFFKWGMYASGVGIEGDES